MWLREKGLTVLIGCLESRSGHFLSPLAGPLVISRNVFQSAAGEAILVILAFESGFRLDLEGVINLRLAPRSCLGILRFFCRWDRDLAPEKLGLFLPYLHPACIMLLLRAEAV